MLIFPLPSNSVQESIFLIGLPYLGFSPFHKADEFTFQGPRLGCNGPFENAF